MNADQRIENLEKAVRRLTVITAATGMLIVGAFLVGTGQGQDANQSWSGPNAVGAPKDGFVVVPTSDGGYMKLSDDVVSRGLTITNARWK
ncbi:MAG: hypothetical protein ACTS3F_05345 [Phycisphaerales bacterium]